MALINTIDLTDEMKKQKLGTLRVRVTLGSSLPLRMQACVLLCRLAAWVCPMAMDVELED